MGEVDEAYTERSRVLAALARLIHRLGLGVGIGLDTDPACASDFSHVLFIDLPEGQVSWHFHDRDLLLFSDLPAYYAAWDGHSTEEKNRRLEAFR